MEKFLCDLPIGAIGLDVGCGNGKYLTVNPDVFIVGSDRSVIGTKNPPALFPLVFFFQFYSIPSPQGCLSSVIPTSTN